MTLKNDTTACLCSSSSSFHSSSLIFEVWLHFVSVPICRARNVFCSLLFCAVVRCFTSSIYSNFFLSTWFLVKCIRQYKCSRFVFFLLQFSCHEEKIPQLQWECACFHSLVLLVSFMQVHKINLNETASRRTTLAILYSVYTGASS